MNMMASVLAQTAAAPGLISGFVGAEIKPDTNHGSEFAEFLQSSAGYSGSKTTQEESLNGSANFS